LAIKTIHVNIYTSNLIPKISYQWMNKNCRRRSKL
jgi:hypothetical protein